MFIIVIVILIDCGVIDPSLLYSLVFYECFYESWCKWKLILRKMCRGGDRTTPTAVSITPTFIRIFIKPKTTEFFSGKCPWNFHRISNRVIYTLYLYIVMAVRCGELPLKFFPLILLILYIPIFFPKIGWFFPENDGGMLCSGQPTSRVARKKTIFTINNYYFICEQ